jgi:hypothetical protein
MNGLRFSTCWRPRLGAVTVLALACGLLPAEVRAQQPAAAKESRPAPDLKIIPLRNAEAQQVIKQLSELFPELYNRSRLVADGNTNSVLVVATPEDYTQIERFVVKLDSAGPGAAPSLPASRQFRVFHLKSIVPDKPLTDALSMIVSPQGGQFVVDKDRRTVIVSANEPSIELVEALLAKLEEQQKPKLTKLTKLRVRIVWLAGSLRPEESADLPKDMKGVAEELATLGIDKLRLVSQSVIDVVAGTPFSSQGVARLGFPCSLSINGTVSESSGESPKLQLSLNGNAIRNNGVSQLCQLSTEMVTPPGHFVVLGVTPTDGSTSVFVVQLLLPK